jgi:hypothetical protein
MPAADDYVEPLPVYEPNQSLARTIGTLNIIFGAISLACGACGTLNLLLQPVMRPVFQAQARMATQQLEAERERRIDRLRQEEKEATSQAEKAEIHARRKAEEARPLPKVPDPMRFFQGGHLLAYSIADALVGIILNIGLLIAGIGLVRLRNWSRVMSIWVATVKILCLTGLLVWLLLWVLPVMVENAGKMFQDMGAAGGAPPGALTPVTTAMTYLWGIGFVLVYIVSLIYPIVILATLTRRSVIAACTEPTVWEIEEPH